MVYDPQFGQRKDVPLSSGEMGFLQELHIGNSTVRAGLIWLNSM